MYEYTPKSDKKLEKLIFFGLVVLGVLFYGGSLIPYMPIPTVLRFLAFLIFIIVIMVGPKFLLCQYIYRIEQRCETDYMEQGLDLVIIECFGKRVRTLLRIELTAIHSMTLVTEENKRELSRKCKGKINFRYMANLGANNRYLLEISHNEELIYVYILSDDILKRYILEN